MKKYDYIALTAWFLIVIAGGLFLVTADAEKDPPTDCAKCAEYRQEIRGLTTRIAELEEQIENINLQK